MNKQLTTEEKQQILKLVLSNPDKSCALAQYLLDTLQVVSLSDYAEMKGKSKRTIQYQSKKLKGINLPDRKYVTLNQ